MSVTELSSFDSVIPNIAGFMRLATSLISSILDDKLYLDNKLYLFKLSLNACLNKMYQELSYLLIVSGLLNII